MLNYSNTDLGIDGELDSEAIGDPDDVELAIKLNAESSTYECAICGDDRRSAVGPELFLSDTWDLVCDECGRKYAPALMALLDLGAAAEGYVTVRDAVPQSDTPE